MDFANLLIETILDKKGTNILLLDIQKLSVLSDYFLICSGDNERQLKAIARDVAAEGKARGDIPALIIEGEPDSGWMLVDFGTVIVHIFSEEKRDYYQLEELWQDAPTILRVQD